MSVDIRIFFTVYTGTAVYRQFDATATALFSYFVWLSDLSLIAPRTERERYVVPSTDVCCRPVWNLHANNANILALYPHESANSVYSALGNAAANSISASLRTDKHLHENLMLRNVGGASVEMNQDLVALRISCDKSLENYSWSLWTVDVTRMGNRQTCRRGTARRSVSVEICQLLQNCIREIRFQDACNWWPTSRYYTQRQRTWRRSIGHLSLPISGL